MPLKILLPAPDATSVAGEDPAGHVVQAGFRSLLRE
jgi:hypothetical protein